MGGEPLNMTMAGRRKMPNESREERVRRVTEQIFEKWHDAAPDTELIRFCAEWDPENEVAFRSINWGYFSSDKPRYLDHRTREMIVSGLLAFRATPGTYTHVRKAMRLGATVNQMLEVFEVAQIPGGGPTRVVGMQAVRKVVEEMKLSGPVDRPPRTAEAAPPPEESREERVRRIQHKIFSDLGHEDEGIALGVELDPDYFERYSQVFWGFFEGRESHLDAITREFVAMVVYAFKNMGEDVYQHVTRALRLGATMHQILECFQVCVAPGGLATLHAGLHALARARREGIG